MDFNGEHSNASSNASIALSGNTPVSHELPSASAHTVRSLQPSFSHRQFKLLNSILL